MRTDFLIRNRRSLHLGAVCLFLIAGTACRQDMHDQPKYKALAASNFFEDHRASRPLVEDTVARGNLREDTVLYTGKSGDQFVKDFPLPVTAELLARGQNRFNIYCTPCHGRAGDGKGMVVSRGAKQPPSYHIDRLRESPHGYFYDVITNGFGAMYDYSAQIQDPKDRWAIVAYIRVLQRSRYSPESDVPASELTKIGQAQPAATPAAAHSTEGAAR